MDSGNNLAFVTYFNDYEINWIPEFIHYHLVVGVEHFYFYYMQEDPSIGNKLLKPYTDKGVVTLTHLPTKNVYNRWRESYALARSNAINEYNWLGFIDTDEFVLPRAKDTIPEILEDYKQHDGLTINWRCFSPLEQTPKSQLKEIIYYKKNLNKHVKCIVKPSKIEKFYNSHDIHCLRVNENYRRVTGAYNNPPTGEKIRINHYVIRSKEEFYQIDKRLNPRKNQKYYDRAAGGTLIDTEIWDRFGDKVEKIKKSFC
ncbi:MAG: glycosyltransferase family 92 protein [Candidatus Dadabacteria bacterium]|nr:glycosyltransferase family 92 protein [Candidatus Dadabacteria bacterium]